MAHERLLPRQQVCDMMCASVREQMMLGVNDYLVIDRTQWMQNWPGQIVLNGSQVRTKLSVSPTHFLLTMPLAYPPHFSQGYRQPAHFRVAKMMFLACEYGSFPAP